MQILVVMPVLEKHKAWLEKACHSATFLYNSTPTIEDVATADVIIGNIEPQFLPHATNLHWLHLNTAGTDGYCHRELYKNNIILTNSTGAYGLALSEYLLATMMAMFKKLYKYYDNQHEHIWIDEGPVQSIQDSTILIVGLGDIGKHLAKKLSALGATVWGIKRRLNGPLEYVDKLGTLENLQDFSSTADVVVNVLPNTPETIHIFNEKVFRNMPPNSYFINGGRGNAVVEDDLLKILHEGHLAGVAIDVTETEPLPQNSPLWDAPRLYITPHTAGQYHLWQTHDHIIKIACDNLQRLQRNERLNNIVDFATGYKN